MTRIKAKTIVHLSEKKFDRRLGELLTDIGEEKIVEIKVYSYAGFYFGATVIYKGYA